VKPKAKAKVAKAEAKKKTPPAATEPADTEEAAAGPQPMVIVPPAQSQGTSEPAATSDQINASDAKPARRSGSFFSFLNSGSKRKLAGKSAERPEFSNAAQANGEPQAATEGSPTTQAADSNQEQVASISPDEQQAQPLPMPPPQAAETKKQGGFLAQLASYRSEAEALAEYDRLRSKYGDVVGGLSPQVTKANVSGTTRYRLGVGPVASREAAARICNSLIAAGERDCLVRGN
jgi:hypothetical protein